MTAVRVALGLFVLVIAASITVGVATSAASAGAPEAPPMGANVTTFMQANAAQVGGAVANGMWAAEYEEAPNASAKRQLVQARIETLGRSLVELEAERHTVEAAYRSGSINRTTYRARLSAVVGRLAAFDDGIDQASLRGRAVGVNETRLETIRMQARDLTGDEVSELARSLAGEPPGLAGLFGDDGPGARGDRGSDGRANGSADTHPGAGDGSDHRPPDGADDPTDVSTAVLTETDIAADVTNATADVSPVRTTDEAT